MQSGRHVHLQVGRLGRHDVVTLARRTGEGRGRRARSWGLVFALGVLAMSTLSCRWLVGGSAEQEGRDLAKRIRVAADLPCIESWAADIAGQTPVVKGGTSIDQEKWPECVRAVRLDERHSIRVMRVVLGERGGGVTLYLNRMWRLTVGVPAEEGRGRWAISAKACLWYVES